MAVGTWAGLGLHFFWFPRGMMRPRHPPFMLSNFSVEVAGDWLCSNGLWGEAGDHERVGACSQSEMESGNSLWGFTSFRLEKTGYISDNSHKMRGGSPKGHRSQVSIRRRRHATCRWTYFCGYVAYLTGGASVQICDVCRIGKWGIGLRLYWTRSWGRGATQI